MIYSAKEETIAAISTPPGAGGIGIIRMSGDDALPTLKMLFSPKDTHCGYNSHKLYYGHIVHPNTGRIIDEVLAVYMAAPHTYTREDVVEIHCHGSFLVLEGVLELILEQGIMLAEPGQFTKRAFLNGRIDLTQAEAVIDILAAKTRKGVDLAQDQLSGALYNRIDPIRKVLARVKAEIEVAIDFPEDDVEIVNHNQVIDDLTQRVYRPLQKLLAAAGRGRLYREGVSMVIAGLPNVGKSSLLNTMVQEDRALVTAIPGTTRDFIEEVIDIAGIPVKIIDTAGIRDAVGEVEELGILRAKELINSGDLVLFVVDGTAGLTEGDVALHHQVQHKPTVAVINKIDLCPGREVDLSSLEGIRDTVYISAREQTGIEALRKTLFRLITADSGQWEEEGCAPNLRHKKALEKSLLASEAILNTLQQGSTYDLIAVELHECLDCLAEIVGETTTEDILDVIFEQFCIGK